MYIYFLIIHHCKTQAKFTEMLKNSSNLLDFLQGVKISQCHLHRRILPLDRLSLMYKEIWAVFCNLVISKKFIFLCTRK